MSITYVLSLSSRCHKYSRGVIQGYEGHPNTPIHPPVILVGVEGKPPTQASKEGATMNIIGFYISEELSELGGVILYLITEEGKRIRMDLPWGAEEQYQERGIPQLTR